VSTEKPPTSDPKKELEQLSNELDSLLEKLPDPKTNDAAIIFESESYNPFITKIHRYRKSGEPFDKKNTDEFSDLESGVNLILGSAIKAQEKIEGEVSRLPMQRLSAKHSVYYRLAEAKEYIDLHFTEEINLEEIASVACLSHYHFLRMFKSVFEITPYQYVIQKRLQKAADLIKSTGTPIGDIAMSVGFDNLPAFSDSFKKEFGVSPSKYRA
jgi:AraC-like DNA-binding protein